MRSPASRFSGIGSVRRATSTPAAFLPSMGASGTSARHAAAVGTTHDPAMRQKLVDQGFVIPPRERQTPEALGAYQKAEIAKWWPIIKAAGTKAE
jgi:hypothetical protein